MTTRDTVSDPRGAWYPLPGGWVRIGSVSRVDGADANITVPDIDALPCRATAPMEHLRLLPYKCNRREGHTGRHAATVKIPGTGVRAVIAVWAHIGPTSEVGETDVSTPSILKAISTAIDDVTAHHRLTDTRDEAVSAAIDFVSDEDAEILERLAGS